MRALPSTLEVVSYLDDQARDFKAHLDLVLYSVG